MNPPSPHSRRTTLAAWGVHLYTGSGAVLAMLALEAIGRDAFGTAFACLAVAMVIDCTDGTLARRVRVKEVLPQFDGAKLDDIVDYLTYALVPIVLIVRAGLVPAGPFGLLIAALPLLASGYGFCQAAAKTPDHFFTGFPSYWNVVALYLFALGWPPWAGALVLLGFTIMVFVPIRYLYPSRTVTLQKTTYSLGIVWTIMVFVLLAQFPEPSRGLARLSLFFPAYYVALSLWLHWRTPPSPQSTIVRT
ncbi:MAG: CDP-alcohol phosphatidyltransferase family protein [Candidatus Binatia bacterium]